MPAADAYLRFKLCRDPDVLGFTCDATGGNLPLDYAPWQPSIEGDAVLVGGGVGPVAEAIWRDRFLIAIEEVAVQTAGKSY